MLDKKTFRAEISARIAALDSDYIAESDRAILERLLELPEFINAPRVFTYLSVGREVDTVGLIEHCRRLGKTLALPISRENGAMSFALLEGALSELPVGRYGIPSPREGSNELIPENGDIIIVPALSCDVEGYRLGHGGGYYDRYLAACKAFSVGLCRETLMSVRLPRDEFDIRLNCLVTEKRIARPK
ncbi:MAG: 5-formyltetrahydrofolate cyclo-ligase [Clostridia bacterium]|nr:5-formyltetrahydrofolate cyclo-ligase [Clostridia bacterium]